MEVGGFTSAGILIIATSVIWLVWDIYVYVKGKNTISHYFTKASWYSPMVPFVLGLLCGHWFW